jgi:lipid A 3-O-deacylase
MRIKFYCLAAALCLLAPSAQAEMTATSEIRPASDDKDILNVVLENDLFAGRDRGYTNGIRFGWLSSEKSVPEWARDIADSLPMLADDGHKRISLAIGQSMYAPANLSSTLPVTGDRPYAAYLYGSVGMVSDTGKTLDNVVLSIGVVGPAALGEPIQKFVHRVIDSPEPMGWDNQLKNEPTIDLTYERKWRALYSISPFGLETDAVPHVGVSLGNVNTSASTGATFRLGFDLPSDYGPPRIRPSLPGSDFFVPTEDLGGYLFTAVEGRAVARNIFLDGNTFRSGPDVDKNTFVGSLQLGAAVTWGPSRLSYTHVLMTKEFETERRAPQFGAVTYSIRF